MEPRCRIVREPNPRGCAVTLSIRGKFDEEAIAVFQEQLQNVRDKRLRVYVDLGEVTLMDQKAARWLSAKQRAKVVYVNCPGYLRRWILSESADLRNDA